MRAHGRTRGMVGVVDATPRVAGQAERGLWVAVVGEATREVVKQRRGWEAAWRWFEMEGHGALGEFGAVCDVLGWDASWVRGQVVRLMQERKNGRKVAVQRWTQWDRRGSHPMAAGDEWRHPRRESVR